MRHAWLEKARNVGVFVAALVIAATDLSGLTLRPERASPYDLEINAGLSGVSAGESRFVEWEQLRALPTRRIALEGEFVPGPQEVTIIDLAQLWARLPVATGRDTLLAWCTDGYLSVFRQDEVAVLRPFVVLEINGRGPESWPPAGLTFNPGPYVIAVDRTLSPAVAALVSEANKKPWGVARLEFVNYAEVFAPLFAQPLTEPMIRGRELWINTCASCHAGPRGSVGGSKSNRPFAVLGAHAATNPDYFARYVRSPQSVNPSATMEAYADLDAAQIEALRLFISELSKP